MAAEPNPHVAGSACASKWTDSGRKHAAVPAASAPRNRARPSALAHAMHDDGRRWRYSSERYSVHGGGSAAAEAVAGAGADAAGGTLAPGGAAKPPRPRFVARAAGGAAGGGGETGGDAGHSDAALLQRRRNGARRSMLLVQRQQGVRANDGGEQCARN